VKLQAAIKACMSPSREIFARPKDWKGDGCALDLGRKKDTTKVRKICALQAPGSALGENWDVAPEDLLGDWELVTLEDLRKEIL
jgi:hypothetical protein